MGLGGAKYEFISLQVCKKKLMNQLQSPLRLLDPWSVNYVHDEELMSCVSGAIFRQFLYGETDWPPSTQFTVFGWWVGLQPYSNSLSHHSSSSLQPPVK